MKYEGSEMKKNILLLLIIFIHIMGYGDARLQYKNLVDKAVKEAGMQNHAKAVEYFIEANTLAKNNNLIKEQIIALNETGIIYMKISDYEKAIEYFLEAYQMAIKEPFKYKKYKINLLNNISTLYSISKNYEKAKEYMGDAYQDAVEMQDSLRAGACAAHLAQIANQTGNLEQAEKYLDIAMLMLKNQTKDSSWLFAAKLERAKNLYLKAEYNKAEPLALEILQNLTSQHLTALGDEVKVDCLLLLSRIYQQRKEFQKAIDALKEALNDCYLLRERPDLYEQLLRVYLDRDASHFAVQYLDSMLMAKDSLAKVANMAQMMNNQVRFELINSQKALAENKAKQRVEKIIFFFSLALIILIVWVIVKMFLIKQKQLHNEIEGEKKQLTSKILFQSNKNELIKEIVTLLTKTPDISEDPAARLGLAVRKLKKMQVKEATEWKSFLTYFEQINPSFLSALKKKYPNLNANEMRLLSYIYLGLDPKEIARLINITPDSYRKKKQRLAQKMDVPTQDIYIHLKKI